MKPFLMVLPLLLLAGCVTPPTPPLPPIDLERAEVQSKLTGSIYANGRSVSFFSDIKAGRVGDILTVTLVEQTTAQNTANSTLSRSTDTSIGAPVLGTRTVDELKLGVESENEFEGSAANGQSNNLNGNIAVTVREVLPGGVLLVEGEKWIQINQAQELVRLEGLIRTRDIQPNNTVVSSQVANARITYSSKGMMANAGRPAWASRFFTSFWPF
jgi:flagellar L-ring protein precursor FlgH